jgi:beta-N-acetylhexosaminidase
VYTDSYDPFAGRAFQNELRAHLPDVQTLLLDRNADSGRLRELQAQADSADVVLFSPFIRVAAGATELAVNEAVTAAINAVAKRRPTVITSFGNPYALQQFPEIGTYLIAWAQWEPAQRTAARALVGLSTIDGRLPIPIPPHHDIGDGLRIEGLRTAR